MLIPLAVLILIVGCHPSVSTSITTGDAGENINLVILVEAFVFKVVIVVFRVIDHRAALSLNHCLA